MPELPEHAVAGERALSTLRQSLKRPHLWLVLTALAYGAAGWDMAKSPGQQKLANAYVGAVRVYQRSISPHLRGHIRCRFRPTCWAYSIDAVRRHGLVRGLMLTARRLNRCTNNVRSCTIDPVT